jgi:N-ethylmaleimide reductase
MSADLFAPCQLGDLTLANRLAMPPMMTAHYRDRAGAGLIITESATVSPQAIGYPFTPGIYTRPHAAS